MSARVTIRARFADFDSMERALHALHGSPLDDYEAYGPIPLTEIEHLMPRKGSPVRIFAAMGGLTGLAAGFGLAIGTALVFRLITGGKPPVSVLPFTVVGFELTILLAVLATFVTVLRACRLAPFAPPAEYDTRYSHETYGVHVRCRRNELDRARRILSEAGGEVADD